MSDMTPERWEYTGRYLREVFGRENAHLAGLMEDAVEAGLPDIAVDAPVGRLLMILASMTRGRLALEVGTLGGYSGIWIARGLRGDGHLITIESEVTHAKYARMQFDRAGLSERVEIRLGPALDILPVLAKELGPDSVDLVFLDAVKTEYPDYWTMVRPLIAPGGLILADNVLGGGSWWIDDEGDQSRDAADRLNRLVASDPDFEAVALPIRQGILLGRRTDEAPHAHV